MGNTIRDRGLGNWVIFGPQVWEPWISAVKTLDLIFPMTLIQGSHTNESHWVKPPGAVYLNAT